MAIEAIPCYYKGYKFRSKLEAQIAVFMDAFGSWDWDYEPQGIVVNGIPYLPDFILHGVNIIYQTKPCKNLYNQDVVIEAKGVFGNDAKNKAAAMQRENIPILIFGNIPDGNTSREIMDDLKDMTNSSSIRGQKYKFYPPYHYCHHPDSLCPYFTKGTPLGNRFEQIRENVGTCPIEYPEHNLLWVGSRDEPIIGTWHTHEGRDDGSVNKTLEAFKQARQARFDHGQHGYIKED